jgi:hypothetical protein
LTVYADTGFLFSLYVPDANSRAAAATMKRIKPPLFATDFAEFELTNALNGRIFRKELRASEEQAVLLSFSRDVQAGVIRIVPISAATFAHARRIARTQTRLLGTRALDEPVPIDVLVPDKDLGSDEDPELDPAPELPAASSATPHKPRASDSANTWDSAIPEPDPSKKPS